jgi:hypothetical protein
VIHNDLSRRRVVVVARDGKEVKGAYVISRTSRNKLCLKTKRGKGIGKKTLHTPPGQEVDIPLVVGGASCSPLTGGINANDSSIGPSIGMSSYDDATIGDNTVSQDTNDELIRMLDENDANDIGDGGVSDAEGEGYKCVISFKHGMREVELEHLCADANEIDSGVEVDYNDGSFVK